ncbi:MAG: hypothetical protein ACI8ZO_000345 [Flavobacteriales bacterium]|jgi:hypothetical protein
MLSVCNEKAADVKVKQERLTRIKRVSLNYSLSQY